MAHVRSGSTFTLDLQRFLEVSREKYEACLDHIETGARIEGVDTSLRFHHLKFDSNGQPKFSDLAKVLADHIVLYCFSALRRGSPSTSVEHGKLNREARKLLRKHDTGGESGELLLYFLLEAVLGAPQVVAKMDLKTNPNVEGLGSDGIHMKWDKDAGVLDIFFGEAKLEKTVHGALRRAFKSMTSFHSDGLQDHELGLVTSHFKHVKDPAREAVLNIVDRQKPGRDCRVNHACLIGYDWKNYDDLCHLRGDELLAEFQRQYAADVPKVTKLVTKRFGEFEHAHLRFEIFFLPFSSVQDFRDAFNEAVS